jgi:hypothetical protein
LCKNHLNDEISFTDSKKSFKKELYTKVSIVELNCGNPLSIAYTVSEKYPFLNESS